MTTKGALELGTRQRGLTFATVTGFRYPEVALLVQLAELPLAHVYNRNPYKGAEDMQIPYLSPMH